MRVLNLVTNMPRPSLKNLRDNSREPLKTSILIEIQVMRKTVVDGSNTTGFQRTALVAMNGYVETPKGKVGIESICLEEEACQKVKDEKDSK